MPDNSNNLELTVPDTTTDIYDDESCATAMYAHRKMEDAADPARSAKHEHPNARELYMLGIHDTIVILEAYAEAGNSPDSIRSLLNGMHGETCPDKGKTCH